MASSSLILLAVVLLVSGTTSTSADSLQITVSVDKKPTEFSSKVTFARGQNVTLYCIKHGYRNEIQTLSWWEGENGLHSFLRNKKSYIVAKLDLFSVQESRTLECRVDGNNETKVVKLSVENAVKPSTTTKDISSTIAKSVSSTIVVSPTIAASPTIADSPTTATTALSEAPKNSIATLKTLPHHFISKTTFSSLPSSTSDVNDYATWLIVSNVVSVLGLLIAVLAMIIYIKRNCILGSMENSPNINCTQNNVEAPGTNDTSESIPMISSPGPSDDCNAGSRSPSTTSLTVSLAGHSYYYPVNGSHLGPAQNYSYHYPNPAKNVRKNMQNDIVL